MQWKSTEMYQTQYMYTVYNFSLQGQIICLALGHSAITTT